jgi:hypothetical protein
MNGHFHITRAEIVSLSALWGAFTMQEVATIASIFAFAATGIYYAIKSYRAINHKDTE